MVALVVGVSSLVRPVLLEAITRVESRPALPGAQDAVADTSDATRDGAPEATNGSTQGHAPEPSTADLLERLFAAPDDVTDTEGQRS
jgi:hypothetical protein